MKHPLQRFVHTSGPYLVRTHHKSYLGVLAFLILVAVVTLHMITPLDSGGRYLISANYYLEWAGTFCLIVAPPTAVVLAFLHWLVTGRVFLSLVSVGMGSFLTLATVSAIVMGYFN